MLRGGQNDNISRHSIFGMQFQDIANPDVLRTDKPDLNSLDNSTLTF